MLKLRNREKQAQNQDFRTANPAKGQGAVSGSSDAQVHQALAQDESGAPIEPYFPTSDEAIGLNKEAFAQYAQMFGDDPTWQGVLKPDGLESAIASARNHWAYDPEPDDDKRLIHGLGKIPWKIAGNQVFGNANKRTATWLLRHSLDQNGLGHIAPYDYDDTELADHLIAQDKYGAAPATMTPQEQSTHLQQQKAELEHNFQQMLLERHERGGPDPSYQQKYPEGSYISNPESLVERQSNILDPIHDQLDPRMWDDPASPEPKLKKEHSDFIHQHIYSTLKDHGYDGMERWLSLVLTGSLTTYQYADTSDCDISLWVDVVHLPEWSRAEMIGIMVQYCDGTIVPGTPFPLQDFVVGRNLQKSDLYKPGLRSGYDMATDTWIVPPDKSRVHDVEHEMNLAYTQALEAADKMDRLLRFEPLQAIRYWHTIHKKRARDMINGEGDYANSNIVYKMLANRGMFDRISEITGEHIASVKTAEEHQGWTNWHTWNTNLMLENEYKDYQAMQEMMANGASPQQVRDYALQHVIGPHNKSAIEDSQEWNSVPEEERVDHHFEDLKNRNPDAADLVNNLGFGPDVSDDEPTLIDPELVNWDEIHHHWKSGEEENQNWEQEKAQREQEGFGWGAGSGHPKETLQMLNAWMKHHGAPAHEDEKLPNGNYAIQHRTFVPIDELNPEHFSGGEQGEHWQQEVVPNGGYNKSTHELGYEAASAIAHGRATPKQTQTMNAALAGEGYTPEQIAEITKQKYAVVPATNERVNLYPSEPQAPDPSLDQPGDLTLPPNWASRR